MRTFEKAFRIQFYCGITGPLLFIVVFLIEGATRRGYDALRYPVSSLSIGAMGWIQAASFVVAGSCIVAFAIGLRRVLRDSGRAVCGPLVIGLAGIGFLGAGLFTSDPIYGYPADAPLMLDQFTVHGHLHDGASILVFIGVPTAAFVLCRRFAGTAKHGWAIYSVLTGFGMLVTFILAAIGFKQIAGFVSIAGVFQRLSIATGCI
jgi:hypothetical membrane protein